MIVSQARINANRINAQMSTGPKTPEGKRISRANAIKHGLCASVCVPEDARLIRERSDEFFNTLKPQNDLHCWVVTEIALASIKIDRCERIERRVRDKISLRAELYWDDDKRLEASLLGEQLGNRPEIVLEQLRRTPQGCEWLMGRWSMLAYSAETKGGWTPAQTVLAFDLLGTPTEFREGHPPGTSLDFQGNVILDDNSPAVVARREVAELEQRRELVSGLDEINQTLAINDHSDDSDPELRRVRRYESALQSRLRWGLRELRIQSPLTTPLRGLKPRWLGQDETLKSEPLAPPAYLRAAEAEAAAAAAMPEPAPLPELKIEEPQVSAGEGWFESLHPPFDLELEELPANGEKADFPKILAARKEKLLRKAQARREAERRKIDKLRA